MNHLPVVFCSLFLLVSLVIFEGFDPMGFITIFHHHLGNMFGTFSRHLNQSYKFFGGQKRYFDHTNIPHLMFFWDFVGCKPTTPPITYLGLLRGSIFCYGQESKVGGEGGHRVIEDILFRDELHGSASLAVCTALCSDPRQYGLPISEPPCL